MSASPPRDEISKALTIVRCMRDVIGTVVGESDLKPLYEEYKEKAELIVKNDLMIKCSNSEEKKMFV